MNNTQQQLDQNGAGFSLKRLHEMLEQVLPSQPPLKDFVHHNTLHGFQNRPFPEALAEASRLTGARGYHTEVRFRELLAEGRISRNDLVASLQQQLGGAVLAPLVDGACVITDGESHDLTPLRRLDVLLASFVAPLDALTPTQLRWRAVELGVLEEPKGLWQACLDVLGLSEESYCVTDIPPDDPVVASWPELADRLGRDWTLRQLLQHLSGEDIFDYLRPHLIRHLAAHLDHGLASWHNPSRDQGFYLAWRESAYTDLSWTLAGLVHPNKAESLHQWSADLPDSAIEAIYAELTRLELPEERWCTYLERLALELPGWSGMCLWSQDHPNDSQRTAVVNIVDYLAVRLVLERFYADALCRRRWGVVAHLSTLSGVRFELPQSPIVTSALGSRAWPLFSLARHLDVGVESLTRLGRAGAEQILAVLGELDEQVRGFIWLNAYERHYREQIFAAVAANHGRGAWADRSTAPEAQCIFCMDDREEGLRRHLEEINPRIETLGAAAHFNVFHRWFGLNATELEDLTPVIPKPEPVAHEVHEHVRCAEAGNRHIRYHRRLRRIAEGFYQGTRSGLLGPSLRSSVAALPVALGLLGKTLAPAAWRRFLRRMVAVLDVPVSTAIQVNAVAAKSAGGGGPKQPRMSALLLGFTEVEQVERVRRFLRSSGLTYGFAPLVVVIGHASRNQNNPHAAAYNCGACSGRHSGPNARLVAAMANHPSVRVALAEEGIIIPQDTWFLGAEHDTCDESITWFDTEDLPERLRPAFATLRADVERACCEHARERCRRFASAPAGLSAPQALRHVQNRAADFGQPRPELGHVTNACAFFGRRSMSRGAFFDRRAFLISYDPGQDPEGVWLERHLLNNGAVGAGISLEYYFSTVDNQRYGCGTKVTHNVTGLMAVMEGANSDLRTGLPRQMIEIHEAMRLLVVIEQKCEIITAVYQRAPALQELVGNGWVVVAAKDPDSPAIHLFSPTQGWLPWQGSTTVPRAARSLDWFLGHREACPPALLEEPDGQTAASALPS